MFRESEAELFYDELRLKENRIAELEMRTPKKTDEDKRYAKETGVFRPILYILKYWTDSSTALQ